MNMGTWDLRKLLVPCRMQDSQMATDRIMVVPLSLEILEEAFVGQVIWYLERVKMNLCIESLPLLGLACTTEGFCLVIHASLECPKLTIQLLIFAHDITCDQTCYENKENDQKKQRVHTGIGKGSRMFQSKKR